MNVVILYGRMANDPTIRYTKTNKAVAQFIVAARKEFKNSEGKYEADFVPCVAFGKTAEICGNNYAKGHRISLRGRFGTRTYKDQEGKMRYISECIVDTVEFVESKQEVEARKADVANTNAGNYGSQTSFEDMGSSVPFDEEVPF